MGGWVDDMYKMTVGQGVVYAYEAYEAKQRVALVRVPFYFRNFGLIPDRQSFCTYLYYSYTIIHSLTYSKFIDCARM